MFVRKITKLVITPDEICSAGDLNFHLDNVENHDSRRFLETLDDHGLVQHFHGATHIRSHTVDIVIIRDNSSILSGEPSIEDPHLYDNHGNSACDHLALHSQLQITRSPNQTKHVSFR